jgi:hypothetical protein
MQLLNYLQNQLRPRLYLVVLGFVALFKLDGKWHMHRDLDAHEQRVLRVMHSNRCACQRHHTLGNGVILAREVVAHAGVNQEKTPLPVFHGVALKRGAIKGEMQPKSETRPAIIAAEASTNLFLGPKPEALCDARDAEGHDPQVAQLVRRRGQDDLRARGRCYNNSMNQRRCC